MRSNGGQVVRTTDGKAYFVPPGADPADAAARVLAYAGCQSILEIHPAGDGVVSWFSQGSAYFSPDGMNLGGGGRTIRAYSGIQRIVGMYEVAGGLVTLLSSGGAYFSPDGMNLGGGGRTARAYDGTQKIVRIEEVAGSLQTLFSEGGKYASSNGLNLGGGGATRSLPSASRLVATSEFGPRDSARGIEWGGRLFLSSGFYSGRYSYYDLWQSTDGGRRWEQVFGAYGPFDEVPPEPFYAPYSPLVEHDGRLVAIGDSVWSSAEGTEWAVESHEGPGVATEDTFVFHVGAEMLFIDTAKGRVTSSPDGREWRAVSDMEGFRRRCGAAVVQAAGAIWIMGGGACDYSELLDDAWRSTDGVLWTRVHDPVSALPLRLPWDPRMWPCVVASEAGTMWMFGGFAIREGVGVNFADVWYSLDGIHWTRSTSTGVGIEPRHAPTCIPQLDDGRILVLGGKGGPDGLNDHARTLNDVWVLEVPVDALMR